VLTAPVTIFGNRPFSGNPGIEKGVKNVRYPPLNDRLAGRRVSTIGLNSLTSALIK
jgi:hypothetical protein